jgi:hypothetical protein
MKIDSDVCAAGGVGSNKIGLESDEESRVTCTEQRAERMTNRRTEQSNK